MKENKGVLNETILNGSKVYVENGEVKTILSEEIQKSGYMTVEEGFNIITAQVKKIYELDANKNNKS